jgi:fructose 1,6-bisphosphatase
MAKTTLGVIKADIGSIGGHIAPSRRLLERGAEIVAAAGSIRDHSGAVSYARSAPPPWRDASKEARS